MRALRFVRRGLLLSALLASSAGALCEESESDEATLIGSLNGQVERQGPALTLHAKQAMVILTDIRCDTLPVPRDCVHRKLVAYEPDRHMFLVENNYYEGRDYIWISDVTGLSIRIKGYPHYSPNAGRFVVVNAVEYTSFNGIHLCRMQPEAQPGLFHPELVLEYSPEEYALYEYVAWEDDDNIQLRVTTWVDHQLKNNLPGRLFKRDPGWHLEGPPERSR